MAQAQPIPSEPTPVDDVRRVRERLDRAADGNVHTLAQQAAEAVEQYRKSLNLKLIATPTPQAQRD